MSVVKMGWGANGCSIGGVTVASTSASVNSSSDILYYRPPVSFDSENQHKYWRVGPTVYNGSISCYIPKQSSFDAIKEAVKNSSPIGIQVGMDCQQSASLTDAKISQLSVSCVAGQLLTCNISFTSKDLSIGGNLGEAAFDALLSWSDCDFSSTMNGDNIYAFTIDVRNELKPIYTAEDNKSSYDSNNIITPIVIESISQTVSGSVSSYSGDIVSNNTQGSVDCGALGLKFRVSFLSGGTNASVGPSAKTVTFYGIEECWD